MNTILGGLFSSRLNLNLREEHGYTYGAGSYFLFRKSPGPFLAFSQVRTDVTGAALSEMLKEIRKMREAPPTPEEMSLAHDSLVRSLPFDFETSASTAGNFTNIFVYDLGPDYYAKYAAQINGVTPGQVQSMAKKYLVPEKMHALAIGDRAKIEAELKALGLAPVEVRDANASLKQE
jgi:zinc protease